jgi:hypothetical protein
MTVVADSIVLNTNDTRSFVIRRVADETLVVPVASRVMDLESIYVLNDVAARIWELLETPTTTDRIADRVTAEFDIDAETAERDVVAFVESLEARGLIRRDAEHAA